MAASGEGESNSDQLSVTVLFGIEKPTDSTVLSPLFKGLLERAVKNIGEPLDWAIEPDTDTDIVTLCLGKEGTLFTRADQAILNTLNSHGHLRLVNTNGEEMHKSSFDLLNFRRLLSIYLLNVIVVDSLSREVSPFVASERSYEEIGEGKFILTLDGIEGNLLIREISGIYMSKGNLLAMCVEYYIAINENGIVLVRDFGPRGLDASDKPNSRLIFDNADVFKKWCEEKDIVSRYRTLEAKVSALLRKAWLKNLPDYKPNNGISPAMKSLG